MSEPVREADERTKRMIAAYEGDQAAISVFLDDLVALLADRDRYRAALEEIAAGEGYYYEWPRIAAAALSDSKEAGNG